jgi:hypothetical protein
MTLGVCPKLAVAHNVRLSKKASRVGKHNLLSLNVFFMILSPLISTLIKIFGINSKCFIY